LGCVNEIRGFLEEFVVAKEVEFGEFFFFEEFCFVALACAARVLLVLAAAGQ